MRHYCTLFDKNYLLFGLALHESMQALNLTYTLHMLAMDDVCADALEALNLPNVEVIRLDQVLVGDLQNIRDTMHFGQVCWTCQPLVCQYLLDKGLSGVTYLEADSYFFADPEVLFDEIGNGSVSLVPHNYAPAHDQTSGSGIYCVQFNFFRNDETGHRFLKQWREACLRYDKKAPLKYPGQTGLDTWPDQSSAVRIIRNPGAGVAPWNESLFSFSERDGAPKIDGQPIVFYHFHELSFIDESTFQASSSYRLQRSLMDIVYRPYMKRVLDIRRGVRSKLPGFAYCKRRAKPPTVWQAAFSFDRATWKLLLIYFRDSLRGNIVRIN